MFFEKFFGSYDFSKQEVAVCCPFPHHTNSGLEYQETNPSAHINTTDRLFHCKVCGEGLSEISFISKILECDYESAARFNAAFEAGAPIEYWERNPLTKETTQLAEYFGISKKVLEELNVKTEEEGKLSFPVLMYDTLLDVRKYTPQGGAYKILSRKGAMSGLVIPYDNWRYTDKNKWTIICAGEKDMAVTRSYGFNAITITGGEKALPKSLAEFRGRKIAICYDNDEAGHDGAEALANYLKPVVSEVRVVTGFHEICNKQGEDLTDFFNTYGKTARDLQRYIRMTEPFSDSKMELVKEKKYPTVTLLQATSPKYINKVVRSNIQVIATLDSSYVVPTYIIATKVNIGLNDTIAVGESKHWSFSDTNADALLKLIDSNLNEKAINENIRALLKIPQKEQNMQIKKLTKETVFKCSVTDLFEAGNADVQLMEYTAYSLKHKLESGKKYKVTYKLVTNPYKGQQLSMIILDVEKASDSVTNFKITPETKANLAVVRDIPGTVTDKMDILTNKVKGILGYDGNDKLIQAIDLTYHTVLEFNFGNFQNIRGYLDTIIVGESRMGKSSTASALQKMYELGVITSLAGNSSTIGGLIGGSNKTPSGFQTRAGLIPQNHKGMIIFEEFAKSNANITKELTDIRSSNEVRITRVSGSISLPAFVRMLTLTNVRADKTGHIKPIASYPNGIEVITELIETAEDIARYDLLLVLNYHAEIANPFWEPETPLSKNVYKDRIRWVWSRTAEQVIIEKEVGVYIFEECKKLNKIYDSHIKIFGTESWKKVTRLAIAVAGYLVSTDDTFENIIVTKEHVNYAIRFLKEIYDNDTFRLKQYVEMERKYQTIDAEGIEHLQDLFTVYSGLLLQLENQAKIGQSTLLAVSGLDKDKFNSAVSRLVKGLFLQYSGTDLVPTQRFRLGMQKINRDVKPLRVGEHNV